MARLAAAVLVAAVLAVASHGVLGQSQASKEISNIPFEAILSGPLIAVIQAQGQVAKTTVNFIQTVGFKTVTNGDTTTTEAVTLDFGYTGVDAQGNQRKGTVTVPILAVMPIPYLQFETIDVELSVKINSMTSYDSTLSVGGSFNAAGSSSGDSGGTWKAGVSFKSESKFSGSQTREYSTTILIHATQPGMPEGMAKVLDALLDASFVAADGAPTSS